MLLCLVCNLLGRAENLAAVGSTFSATDTIDLAEDESADARDCLSGLSWTPGDFEILLEQPSPGRGDLLVRFASPRPSGDQANDQVAMEWYMARDRDRQRVTAPAMVVVHESGSNMEVGRMIARGVRSGGIHALLIHLPYYGVRRTAEKKLDGRLFVSATHQGIADVRRARDVVAALPFVEIDRIGLQGTSLGGFVAATSAGLDNGYDAVFLMLAGGDLYDVIQNGAKDAAEYRRALAKAGFANDLLRRAA